MASLAHATLKPLRRFTALLSLVLFLSVTSNVGTDESWKPARVFSTFKNAVFRVTATGNLYNGEVEVETGSGFVINKEGLAITANHVTLPQRSNYKSVALSVSLGPKREAVVRNA